jgi:hypothetical protein
LNLEGFCAYSPSASATYCRAREREREKEKGRGDMAKEVEKREILNFGGEDRKIFPISRFSGSTRRFFFGKGTL